MAASLGLRASEIMGLQWSDFDWQNRTVLIRRGVVNGRIGDTKTEASRKALPVDSSLADALLELRRCLDADLGLTAVAKIAIQEMIDLLMEKTSVSRSDANRIAGITDDLHMSEVADKKVGAYMTIAKTLLENSGTRDNHATPPHSSLGAQELNASR